MSDRFTERARKVLRLARNESIALCHDYIGTEHLLLALIKEDDGVAASVLSNLGLSFEKILEEVKRRVPKGTHHHSLKLELTPKAKYVLELAMEEARKFGHNYIGTEHLLLGLILEEDGLASILLNEVGISLEKIQKEIVQLLGTSFPIEQVPKSESKSGKLHPLESFAQDLTEIAKQGKLDPVIGRKDEIERLLETLGRRKKNNPVLLGEPGVGKTSVVEGLAQKIVEGNVPENLLSKRIFILDIALMVAGTKYRGQFEERIKAIMDEVKKKQNIILFIDEIHTLVGAGGAEGAIDASNILKPALSKGDIQVIGATTFDEYRKHVEKDAALERRFQKIVVDAPNLSETTKILKGLRDKYEAHHKVKITDDALVAAVNMSDRYISDRFLPDKAIDIMDEAASKVRLSVTTLPKDFHELKHQMTRTQEEKKEAIKNQDFESAASLRDKEKSILKEMESYEKSWRNSKSEIETVVTVEDVAEVISKITGLPVTRLTEKESERLVKMDEILKTEVIGQEEGIAAISHAIRRSCAGLKDITRPVGSFVFLGPTGVGKTLLAKSLAKFLFGDESVMITVDMSEYMEKFSVSRLTGAPPGYIGYEEGGELVEKVRRRPYSVILFDEMEKAHPDVFNILLQILEEGFLTDSCGRRVDFRNTVILMTSNIGAEKLREDKDMGFHALVSERNLKDQNQIIKNKLLGELKKAFRPEFLNRIDELIVFNSLSFNDLKKILRIEIKKLEKLLLMNGIEITLSPKAEKFLINKGFHSIYGARPLKRTIQKEIENPLSELILEGKLKSGDQIKVTAKEKEGLLFKTVNDKKICKI